MTYEVEYTTPLPDASLITYNSVTREFTIVGSDLTWAGNYTVTVKAMDMDGAYTGTSFNFNVEVIDPCVAG